MPQIKYILRLRADSTVIEVFLILYLGVPLNCWLHDSDALSACPRRWKIFNLQPYRPAVRVSTSPLDEPGANVLSARGRVTRRLIDGGTAGLRNRSWVL